MKHGWITCLAAFALTAAFLVGTGRVLAGDASLPVVTHPLYASLLLAAKARDLYGSLEFVQAKQGLTDRDEDGRDPMLVAAATGQPHLLHAILAAGADGASKDKAGDTVLHLAARAADLYTVRMLKQMGFYIDVQNADGETPLYQASRDGKVEVVKTLLTMGASHDISRSAEVNDPPWMAAMAARHWDVTAIYRALGFDPGPHKAAAYGDLAALKEYAATNPKLLSEDDKLDRSPLFYAVSGDHLEVATFLMDQGVPLNESVFDAETPFFVSLQTGDKIMIEAFLNHGMDINQRDNTVFGNTALNRLAAEGNTDMMRFMIEKGARINQPNVRGYTPLHAAADANQLESVRFLVSMGAALNIKNRIGQTALHIAGYRGEPEIASVLLDNGADIGATDSERRTPLHLAVSKDHAAMAAMLLDRGADLALKDKNGQTPLHLAAGKGLQNAVKLLLERGASPNAQDAQGETPLHCAATAKAPGVIALLLAKTADPNILNKKDQGPLYNAVVADDLDCAQKLQTAGARVDVTDKDGRTLLFDAVHSANDRLVRWLTGLGVPVNAASADGRSALHETAQYGCLETLQFLLSQNAEVNKADPQGITPLHLASERGNVMNVKLLVEKGADMRAKDADGRLPMHYAAVCGHWGPCQLFILRGVDVNAVDGKGNTVLHLAAAGGQQRTARLLLGRNADFTEKNADGDTPLSLSERSALAGRGAVGLTPIQVGLQQGREATLILLRAVAIDEISQAVARGDLDGLKRLLDAFPAFVNARRLGLTPLHRAAGKPSVVLVELLLARGADVSALEDSVTGFAPLHDAAAAGQQANAEKLITAGASPAQPSALGLTPEQVARGAGFASLADWLKAKTS